MRLLRVDPARRSPRIIRILISVGFTLMIVIVFSAACGGSSDTTTTAGSSTTGGAQVVAKNIAFNPAEVTISVGETVTWTNEDAVTHTVAADNGEFESGDLENGDSFSFTFDQAGSYPYHCTIHPDMTGTVTVQ